MSRHSLIELEAVLAIVRCGSFRAAALDLGMSTTAISNAVGKLERDLAVRLFNRTTRSVALTHAGRIFVAQIKPAFEGIQKAMDTARSQQETPSGTLRINSFATAAREIMVPLVGLRSELDFVKARIDQVASDVMSEAGQEIAYLVGTMIELPRAAIQAGSIAEAAEFFSFGTNDLTQTTFGISRDDAQSFLQTYRQKGIIDTDPFVTIDTEGVGELVRIASEKGRATRPGMKLGICGEHGGDPASIRFCESVGLDYVSCSPFRVPIARLAAAQAVGKGE